MANTSLSGTLRTHTEHVTKRTLPGSNIGSHILALGQTNTNDDYSARTSLASPIMSNHRGPGDFPSKLTPKKAN